MNHGVEAIHHARVFKKGLLVKKAKRTAINKGIFALQLTRFYLAVIFWSYSDHLDRISQKTLLFTVAHHQLAKI